MQEEEIDLEAELGVELGTGDDGEHEGAYAAWIPSQLRLWCAAQALIFAMVCFAEEESKDEPAPAPARAAAAPAKQTQQEQQLSKKVRSD